MVAFTRTDKEVIGNLLIVSGILALASILVGLVAAQFDFDAFTDPLKLLEIPGVNPSLVKWFLILDLFGYYLLLLPFLFFAHQTMISKTAWANVFTCLGFSYILIGMIGAATLAVIWPSIITQYQSASPASMEYLRGDFSLATDFVVKGLWNHLEVLLGGIWWIALSVFMFDNRSLKIATLVLGIACLADSIGELLTIPVLAEIGLNVYLLLGIIWPVWVGVWMRKGKL